MSDFAPELAKYRKSCPKLLNNPKWDLENDAISVKFHRPYRKSGLPSKNMMSDFVLELAKYPKRSRKPQNSSK